MRKKNRKKHNYRWLKDLIMFIVPIILMTGITYGINEYRKRTTDAKLVNSQEVIENKLEEKQLTIDGLNKEIEELKNKQIELEEKIKQIEISKKEKAVTSRGNSLSESRTTSTQIATKAKWIWGNISAYCSCAKCCGKTNGITASGTKATANRTIAASSIYKFGTKIEIEGLGVFTVEDRGGAITGNKIDVYMNSHQEALQFGRRNLRIRIVE